jgi:hypothetical protein
MELVAFVGGSLHRTLKEIEHNANRLIFLKETYIKVTDDVYILESLDRKLYANKKAMDILQQNGRKQWR